MIRLMLVDDQTLVRRGIRSLLELAPELSIVGEAADGVEAIEVIRRVRPDVVLLDLRMPRMDGIAVLEELRTWPSAPPALVLTTFDDDLSLLQALQAGAKGYLLKDISLEQLLEAVQAVHEGRTLVQPAMTARILSGLRAMGRGTDTEMDPLTERETEVLRLMSGGFSNKEIARGLDLAEGTVKNHVSHILTKMGVRDRTKAVLKAIEAGLI